MTFLAIDTTTDICALSLGQGEAIATRQMTKARHHAESILTHIDDLLHTQSCQKTNIKAVIVGCGPGSFTGVRLGMSIAQGLAYGLECPIVPLNSLAILAQAAYLYYKSEKIITAMLARTGECYWCECRINANHIAQAEQAPRIQKIQALETMQANNMIAVGNAWSYLDKIPDIDIKSWTDSTHELAKAALLLGQWHWQQGNYVNAADLMPNYVLDKLYNKI